MKRIFLLSFVLLIISSLSITAQVCTPDNTLPDSVAVAPLPFTEENPDRGIADTACVNVPYETFFQINLPPSVVVFGNEVALNSATIPMTGGVQNLPASMTYDCNPPNCVFTSDTTGCIRVYGTATVEEIGVHDLMISTTLDIGIPYNTTLPDDNLAPGNYFMHVKPEGSENCATVAAYEVVEKAFEMRMQPNPASDYAEIFVNLPSTGRYNLAVYNAQGSLAQTRQLGLLEGENYIDFDASRLPVGLYIFVIDNGQQAASGRLLIQR